MPGVPAPPAAAQPAMPSGPGAPAMPLVPAQLPKIAAKTAAEICSEYEVGPAAKKLLTPQQTPSQFLTVLQEKHLGADMVKVLAYGLPDRDGVAWAVQCAQMVADQLPPADVQAMQAAQAWVKNPTPETQNAAAEAAKRTDHQGPGAWAAQAAAWAGSGNHDASGDSDVPKRLTPHAVSGAVQIASANAVHAILGLPNLTSPQIPTTGSAALPAIPQVNAPRLSAATAHLSGAAAQFQGGVPTAPQLAAMAEQRAMAHAGGSSIPQVAGIASLAQASIPGMSAMQAPAAQIAGVQMPGVQMPNLATPNLPTASGSIPAMPGMPSIPQGSALPMPPEMLMQIFSGQHSFIALGIEIAAGKSTPA